MPCGKSRDRNPADRCTTQVADLRSRRLRDKNRNCRRTQNHKIWKRLMDGLSLFGLFAVSAMLVFYALEHRSRCRCGCDQCQRRDMSCLIEGQLRVLQRGRSICQHHGRVISRDELLSGNGRGGGARRVVEQVEDQFAAAWLDRAIRPVVASR